MKIAWDLEAAPLQIKTDSELASYDHILVTMYDKDSNDISTVSVRFSSAMDYAIGKCVQDFANLPKQPPVEVDKIWTIAKTGAAWIITCNDVEVLNFLFAESSKNSCDKKWGGDVVEEIKFSSGDKASDFYKAGRGQN